MTKEERHSIILDLLLQNDSILVTDLAEKLNVSSVTIRKDLTELENAKKLYRNHGKAILIDPYIDNRNVSEKEKLCVEEKRLIGIKAASLITPKDSILIASGTTVHHLARNIHATDKLTVITASLEVASILSKDKNIDIIQLGGIMRHSSKSVVGKYAEQALSDFSCSKDVALAIVGFSSMGQTMLISALRIAHFARQRKTKVLIIDPNADCLLRDFMALHPGCDSIPGGTFLDPVNTAVSSAMALAELDKLRANHQLTIALTYRNTDLALTDAILLKKKFGNDFTLLVRQDSSVNHSLSIRAEHLTLYHWENVFFFGRRCDSAYNPWHREILAKQLHEKYLETLKDRLKASQLDWDYLEEQYRWKYRYQIDSLPEMLHSVGINIVPIENEADRKAATSFSWTEMEITNLAECSHNRWWADRILEGWSYGKSYDKPNRKAPNMRPYSELLATARDIDFQFIGKIPACLNDIGYYLKRIEQ